MSVDKQVFTDLLELYPRTKESLPDVFLLKREIMLHYRDLNLCCNYERE